MVVNGIGLQTEIELELNNAETCRQNISSVLEKRESELSELRGM